MSSTTAQEAADVLFRNKEILAPMVRASTTPLRTLALSYGADLVYSEEIVDRSITTNVERIENEELKTIDYCRRLDSFSKKQQRRIKSDNEANGVSTAGGPVILRIVPELERGRFIYQMGTGESALALKAALTVHKDVAGVDVNMGCPKKFSVSGGMGSALLDDVDRACDILRTLRRNLPSSLSVSCKIRLLSTDAATVDLATALCRAGANAVAVHARERPHDSAADPANWERLVPVVAAIRNAGVPAIVNGDAYDRADVDEIRRVTGADAVMLARPALYNASVFRTRTGAPLLDKPRVVRDYLAHATRWRTHVKNAKYVVCEMMSKRRHPHHLAFKLPQTMWTGRQTIGNVCDCHTMRELCDLWDVSASAGVGETTTTTEPERLTTEHRYDNEYFLRHERREEQQRTFVDQSTEHKATDATTNGSAPRDAHHRHNDDDNDVGVVDDDRGDPPCKRLKTNEGTN